MFAYFSAWWRWFRAFFGSNGDVVRSILEQAAKFIDLAIPIVQDIDKTIKAFLQSHRDQPLHQYEGIIEFLRQRGVNHDVSVEIANSLHQLPINDILVNLAVVLLKQVSPSLAASSSFLRLVIELAYNVYKGSVK